MCPQSSPRGSFRFQSSGSDADSGLVSQYLKKWSNRNFKFFDNKVSTFLKTETVQVSFCCLTVNPMKLICHQPTASRPPPLHLSNQSTTWWSSGPKPGWSPEQSSGLKTQSLKPHYSKSDISGSAWPITTCSSSLLMMSRSLPWVWHQALLGAHGSMREEK